MSDLLRLASIAIGSGFVAGAIALSVSALAPNDNGRFATVNAGNGAMHLVDRATGAVRFCTRKECWPVNTMADRPEPTAALNADPFADLPDVKQPKP